MKLSMRLFVFGLVSIFTVGSIAAQRGQKVKASPEERAERQTNRMIEELALSPEQAKEVTVINLKFANTKKDKSSRKELRDQHDGALAEVLTPEQIAKWKTVKKKGRKGKGKAKGVSSKSKISPIARAEKMTNRMNKNLSLTDNQLEKVADINREFALATAELHDSNTEKPDRNEMKSLKENHRTALKSVLTPSQMKEWKADCDNGKCSKKKVSKS